MKTLRERLAAITDKLGLNKDALGKARRRYRKFHPLAVEEHAKQVRAEKHGHMLRAAFYKRRAESRHAKAVYWRARIKQQVARIHHLERSEKEIEAEITKWHKEHGVYMEGPNKVRGGEIDQRLRYAIHKAALNYRQGKQPGYYSQSGGSRAYAHGLYHYPGGRIWDCSTFADAVYYCCGLPSPSGPNAYETGGWTGTEGEHGKRVDRAHARSGDLVLYGSAPHHHVEVVDDPEAGTTIGHGSPPIDAGVFDLFGDGNYEIRTYR